MLESREENEERAERRDGGGAVEEFVMLVSCTGYGARTIGLKLYPRQASSNESRPVRSSHSRLAYQPKRPSTALEQALDDVTGRTEDRRRTMIPVLSYLEGLSPMSMPSERQSREVPDPRARPSLRRRKEV